MFKSFFSSFLDEMKRRRDFYAAHPSADGKLFRGGKTFYLRENLSSNLLKLSLKVPIPFFCMYNI